MNILTFELSGKFAHFRKYYANNTALSYFVPPRTSLMGMIAAVMGYPRDSYYETLCSEHLRIGLRVLAPMKKRIHRVNWLKVEGAMDFRGRQQHTQTPFELVSGLNPVDDLVRYRVYMAAAKGGESTFEQICEVMQRNKQVFAITLGPANLGGSISNIQLSKASQAIQDPSRFVDFHSAINAELVEAIEWDQQKKLRVEEELLPADFIANNNRELRKMVRILYATDGQPLRVKFSGESWMVPVSEDQVEQISFIE